jgi:hypothetical protein
MLSADSASPVPYGPAAYARRLRRAGWLMALVVPALLLGATAVAKAALTCPTGQVCSTSFATNWVLPGMALPTAILWGVPLHGGTPRYIGVVATSALVWALLGIWASGRATRRPIASWRTWFREYLLLLAGVWIGVFVGLLALAALVGQGTFSNLL